MVGNIHEIEQIAAEMRKNALAPNEAILRAQGGIRNAKLNIDAAQGIVDDWGARLKAAKAAVTEAESRAGDAAFAGGDVAALANEIASMQAQVGIAEQALHRAGQAHEQACIDYERATCALWQAQLEQQQERIDDDYALVQAAIEPLRQRPGGLHVFVDYRKPGVDNGLQYQLASMERSVQSRQEKLDKVRGAK